MKAWVRIDADVFAHPKFAGISPAGFTAWVKGLGHCRQFRTDGVIAARVVPTIATKKVREDLLERGLWHKRHDRGIEVHGYAAYQLTEADWHAKSEAGKLGAAKRWHNDEMPPAIAPAIADASDSHATPIATDSDFDPEGDGEELFFSQVEAGLREIE